MSDQNMLTPEEQIIGLNALLDAEKKKYVALVIKIAGFLDSTGRLDLRIKELKKENERLRKRLAARDDDSDDGGTPGGVAP
jgi:hypothetical protein